MWGQNETCGDLSFFMGAGDAAARHSKFRIVWTPLFPLSVSDPRFLSCTKSRQSVHKT